MPSISGDGSGDLIPAFSTANADAAALDHRVIALPHDALRKVLKKYGRLTP
jgi:hypothetical protein